MKLDETLKLNTDLLTKTMKKIRTFTWVFGIILLLLICLKGYDFYETRKVDVIMVIPIVFIPMLFKKIKELKAIKKELNSRNDA